MRAPSPGALRAPTSPEGRGEDRRGSQLSVPQAEIVALDAAGVDRSRDSQRWIGRLPFLEAPEFSGGVELDRILVFALKLGQCLLALLRGVEAGHDTPARKRSRWIYRVCNLGGIGRHPQIPADECERSDVASFPVAHGACYTPLTDKKSC